MLFPVIICYSTLNYCMLLYIMLKLIILKYYALCYFRSFYLNIFFTIIGCPTITGYSRLLYLKLFLGFHFKLFKIIQGHSILSYFKLFYPRLL